MPDLGHAPDVSALIQVRRFPARVSPAAASQRRCRGRVKIRGADETGFDACPTLGHADPDDPVDRHGRPG